VPNRPAALTRPTPRRIILFSSSPLESEAVIEVQTFFLAVEVRRRGPGDFTATTPCVNHFSPPGGEFPLEVRLPYLMLVRRASGTADNAIALKFNLIDEDGRNAGKPSNVRVTGKFARGEKTLLLAGHVVFSFPAPGDYRLDITADHEESATLYSYDIEIGAGHTT
jgi:hypothetical protein